MEQNLVYVIAFGTMLGTFIAHKLFFKDTLNISLVSGFISAVIVLIIGLLV